MRKFPGSDVRELFLFFPEKGVYLPVNRISPTGVIPNTAATRNALYMEGEHLCKTMRGAKKQGTMSCCHLTGIFKENAEARAEFLAATREGR